MRKILLDIFFFAVISTILIYYLFHKDNKSILLLGENIYKEIENNKTFFYDKITYKELIRNINNDDSILVKGNRVYLNQLIYESNYIFIYTSDENCKKYIDNISALYNSIRKISDAIIIIIEDKCNYKHKNNKIITINKELLNNNKINDIVKKIDSA